jgi:hypothetical protein
LKQNGGDPQAAVSKIAIEPDANSKDEGFLIKVAKGIYKTRSLNLRNKQELHDFDEKTKKEVLARDGHKCIVCGLGKENGAELHVDLVKA